MDLFTGVIVYILVWWVSIFAVLPWGLERDRDGTPKNLNMWRKVCITTVLSAVIWFGIYLVIESDIISFREMVAKDVLYAE